MIVYEITSEYAPVFAEYVPAYLLSRIGKEGYHTLGEVVSAESKYYTAGFLQYYDGRGKKGRQAMLTYLYVPAEERREANAWSLLKEMESRLNHSGISKIFVEPGEAAFKAIGGYLGKMGFEQCNDKPELLTATLGELKNEKIMSLHKSDLVTPLGMVPKTVGMQILTLLGTSAERCIGLDRDIYDDFYTKRISMMYHNNDSQGLLLVGKRPDGGLIIKLCRCTGKDVKKAILYMISSAAKAAEKLYSDETPVFIPCYNKNTMSVIRAINPEVALVPVWQGEKTF
jgi:hypothetical protein